MSPYLKAIVALVGGVFTAVLGTVPPNTTVWDVLTVIVGLLTAAGVYLAPNTPDPGTTPPPPAPPKVLTP